MGLFFFEDLIKIEDAGVATTLKIYFSNIQGQLTPQSRVESGSNSKSYKTLWLSLFLPRMKKFQSKLKVLEWPQYKILIFQTLKGSQRSDLAEIRTHSRYCSYSCYLQELKNKDARVATTQTIDFSNTQGQITPQSEVGSGRNFNTSEIL